MQPLHNIVHWMSKKVLLSAEGSWRCRKRIFSAIPISANTSSSTKRNYQTKRSWSGLEKMLSSVSQHVAVIPVKVVSLSKVQCQLVFRFPSINVCDVAVAKFSIWNNLQLGATFIFQVVDGCVCLLSTWTLLELNQQSNYISLKVYESS